MPPKAKQKPKPQPREQPSANDQKLGALVHTTVAIGRVAERFGVSFVLLVLILASVYLFADAATKNEFMRAILFAEKAPWLAFAFWGLVVSAVIPTGIWRAVRSDRNEMKRMAAEKSRLQEELLGRKLHHTDGGPTLPAIGGQK